MYFSQHIKFIVIEVTLQEILLQKISGYKGLL
jgi:hypothetical protein